MLVGAKHREGEVAYRNEASRVVSPLAMAQALEISKRKTARNNIAAACNRYGRGNHIADAS